ncbi:MAG: glycosyltransferase family 2 protein, partial [Oligoflexia bacterium]|nr:glycosyltransferase family 2 protein [Oligoflexia bacterium]
MKQTDITVIVTAHNEGLLALRSLRSAKRSRVFAERGGRQVETLIVLDSGSDATRALLQAYPDLYDRIVDINCCDAALARNEGVKQATGKYVAFLDADDLFSENWLLAAYDLAEKSRSQGKTPVLHPALNYEFGVDPVKFGFYFDPDQEGKMIAPRMLKENLWSALSFTAREVLLNIPIPACPRGSGFGFEDWSWNCETLAHGFEPKLVPMTVHFIRRKKQSRNIEQLADRAIVGPTSLFDDASLFENLPLREKTRLGNYFRQALSYWLQGFYYLFYRPLAVLGLYRGREYIPHSRWVEVPNWVLDEMAQVSAIEPELLPKSDKKPYALVLDPLPVTFASAYGRLLRIWEGGTFKNVILVGKAEQNVKAIVSRLEGPVLLVIDGCSNGSDASIFPAFVKTIYLGDVPGLLSEDVSSVLVRLLIQKHPAN